MPSVQKMQEELAGRSDALILAFNSGSDSRTVVADYWKDAGFTFDAVLEPEEGSYANMRALGVRMFPTNIVIGPDGVVRYAQVGFDEGKLRQLLGLRPGGDD